MQFVHKFCLLIICWFCLLVICLHSSKLLLTFLFTFLFTIVLYTSKQSFAYFCFVYIVMLWHLDHMFRHVRITVFNTNHNLFTFLLIVVLKYTRSFAKLIWHCIDRCFSATGMIQRAGMQMQFSLTTCYSICTLWHISRITLK